VRLAGARGRRFRQLPMVLVRNWLVAKGGLRSWLARVFAAPAHEARSQDATYQPSDDRTEVWVWPENTGAFFNPAPPETTQEPRGPESTR
jgi:hypothetical protein